MDQRHQNFNRDDSNALDHLFPQTYLETASGRSQIEEALDPTMDFEGRHHEHFSDDQVIEGLSVELRFVGGQLGGEFPGGNFKSLKRFNGFLDIFRVSPIFLKLPNGSTLLGDLCVQSVELVLDLGGLFCRWCFRHFL